MQDSTMPHSIKNAPTTAQPVRKNVTMKNETGRDKKHFNPLLFQQISMLTHYHDVQYDHDATTKNSL